MSEMFNKKGDDMTKKSAGSPAFMAPELCKPDHGEVSGRATDVWSMGVTLYCVRYGLLPFISSNIIDLNRFIRDNDFEMPGEQDQRFMDLMKRLLEKDPSKRISLDELRVSTVCFFFFFFSFVFFLEHYVFGRSILFVLCNKTLKPH